MTGPTPRKVIRSQSEDSVSEDLGDASDVYMFDQDGNQVTDPAEAWGGVQELLDEEGNVISSVQLIGPKQKAAPRRHRPPHIHIQENVKER